MSGDAELLNFIYQNSQMGVDTIRQLIGVVGDKDLKEHLKTQFQGYEEFHQAAKELLNEHGYDEKGLGIMEKARTYFMINLQTITDPSVSHIASMLITGSSMGIVEAIQKYRQYEDADPKIRDPAVSADDSNPRISWGKAVTSHGRTTLPVSLYVNHALADGLHISQFFAGLERELQTLADSWQAEE